MDIFWLKFSILYATIQDWAWIKMGNASLQEHDKLHIGILQPLTERFL